ncbi:hypothetical protein EDEG_01519 [Edhazardia aedis USNM 41457]|uniref:DNA-directed RNA polymerase subunit n=1 Tax=Edhazardia aedis (strain USNM 41457) TaxID=1003232 RepID=J9DSA7_EDHAE|nr:hypothetical protein EDEG_01519 [Edhazardia aedis USNM 41457]|eukprot:EJW04187.1 hypothetical protein EDEG_01519 [Edhazardia aedis USNM 41457]
MKKVPEIPRSIDSIYFTVLDEEKIRKQSSVEVLYNQMYGENKEPLLNGPLDPHLGSSRGTDECVICKETSNCPGHFGHVNLVLPVFHCGFFKHVYNVLQCVCKCCGELLIKSRKIEKNSASKDCDGDDNDIISVYNKRGGAKSKLQGANTYVNTTYNAKSDNGQGLKSKNKNSKSNIDNNNVKKDTNTSIIGGRKLTMRELIDESRKVKSCLFCLSPNISIKRGPGYKLYYDTSKIEINPLFAYNLFKLIKESDYNDLHITFNPVNLLIKSIPVPPSIIRPSVKMLQTSNEDDLTVKLCEIISTNNNLKVSIKEGKNMYGLQEDWDFLQLQVNLFINSDLPNYNKTENVQGIRGIVQRLKGKHGRFRGNLSGKRVDFSGRTVISPDPCLSVEEVGVPVHLCKILTVSEVVNVYNIDKLNALLNNSVFARSGKPYTIDDIKNTKNYSTKDLKYTNTTLKTNDNNLLGNTIDKNNTNSNNNGTSTNVNDNNIITTINNTTINNNTVLNELKKYSDGISNILSGNENSVYAKFNLVNTPVKNFNLIDTSQTEPNLVNFNNINNNTLNSSIKMYNSGDTNRAYYIYDVIEKYRKYAPGYPGINYIETKNGKVSVQYAKPHTLSLRYGDIVERHLLPNDIVLFNRQPSLHRISIMAHKVMPHINRTLRFNECCCTPYNADFDGDEMNIHVPQTLESMSEARTLLNISSNLCTPRNGEPLIACTQDFITGMYVLTSKQRFFGREEVGMLVGSFLHDFSLCENVLPAVLRPVVLFTGKQVFNILVKDSLIRGAIKGNIINTTNNIDMKNFNLINTTNNIDMKNFNLINTTNNIDMKNFNLINTRNITTTANIYDQILKKLNLVSKNRSHKDTKEKIPFSDTLVCIKEGNYYFGQIDKSIIGSENKKGSLVYALLKIHPQCAVLLMNSISRLSSFFLSNYGFSIGLNDVELISTLKLDKNIVCDKIYKECDDKIKLFEKGEIKCLPGCTSLQTLESNLSSLLSQIREECGSKCLKRLGCFNSPIIMQYAGSKGSKINVAQMVACVGQQIISGKRISDGFSSNIDLPSDNITSITGTTNNGNIDCDQIDHDKSNIINCILKI